MTGNRTEQIDVVVIGGGPAGLEAGRAARQAGAERVLVLDREPEAGGILRQCIHTGFGLHHYHTELTGPEYAERALADAQEAGVKIACSAAVFAITTDRSLAVLQAGNGLRQIQASAVILAMGARERTRGAIRIPGERPAGVMTAGLAQEMVNLRGVMPGKRAVILGSGDIGLIMARRLVLEDAKVSGVFEIMPHPSGLKRNIVQCLQDFDIPLHLGHTITHIHGSERVEAVTVAPVDDRMRPDLSKSWRIPCDTVLLSIGLIPENELSQELNIRLDAVTGGPVVDSRMQTSVNGVFACGNVVHIHDLVDFVSLEATLAGTQAALYARNQAVPGDDLHLLPGRHIRYAVPQTLSSSCQHRVFLRVCETMQNCRVELDGQILRKLPFALPTEMISIKLDPDMLRQFEPGNLTLDVVPETANPASQPETAS